MLDIVLCCLRIIYYVDYLDLYFRFDLLVVYGAFMIDAVYGALTYACMVVYIFDIFLTWCATINLQQRVPILIRSPQARKRFMMCSIALTVFLVVMVILNVFHLINAGTWIIIIETIFIAMYLVPLLSAPMLTFYVFSKLLRQASIIGVDNLISTAMTSISTANNGNGNKVQPESGTKSNSSASDPKPNVTTSPAVTAGSKNIQDIYIRLIFSFSHRLLFIY